MSWVRVRNLFIVLPLFALSGAFFLVGMLAAGVILFVLASGAVLLLARAGRLAARTARGPEGSAADMRLRWQNPGNSGGGSMGG
jgi:hypothetical protein